MTARAAPIPPRPIAIRNAHPRLRLDRRGLRVAVHLWDAQAARFHGGCPEGELSLAFLTDAALARLHGDFLADPSPTDVITFAGSPEWGVAGEICVSVDTAAAYARRHQRDLATELTLYVLHGWLHLAGYDDLEPRKKRLMRAAEARGLRLLQAAGAVPEFSLLPDYAPTRPKRSSNKAST